MSSPTFSAVIVVDAAVLGKPPISPPTLRRSPSERRNSTSPLHLLRSAGRKLPEVRSSTGAEDITVRHSTEVSIGRSNTMPRRRKEVEYSKEKILQELGIGMCSIQPPLSDIHNLLKY